MVTADQVYDAYFSGTHPHPIAVRITAAHIIPARAKRITGSKAPLRRLAHVYADYSRYLASQHQGRWARALALTGMGDPSGDSFQPQSFRIPNYYGSTTTITAIDPGIQLRRFEVFETPPEEGSAICIASLSAIEHIRYAWEIVDVEVKASYRRRGIASALYDAVEEFIRFPIRSPSGWLTADALAFWEKRKPLTLPYFVRHPECDEIYVSPKQLILGRKAYAWMLLDSAAPATGAVLN